MFEENYMLRTSSFFNDNSAYDDSNVILIGIPMDYTASNIPGARFAPKKIRDLSLTLENYSPVFNEIIDLKFCDAGDIILPWGNIDKSLALIDKIAMQIVKDGKKIVSIGGDHLVTLPIIRQFVPKYAELAVVHIDAHTDLRDEWNNEKYSHATVMRRVHEIIKKGNLYQFGIRSGSKEEFEFAGNNTHLFKNDVFEPIKKVIGLLKNSLVYLTIDIDVLDPAYAPGTGYLEAGGISSRELFDAIELIFLELNVIGADVVEVCPPTDNSERTSAIAAKLVREIIIGINIKKYKNVK